MVKEAEANKADDEKRKAGVEAKNQADAVIHSTEKALAEHGDKVSPDEKAAIQTALDDLKGVVEGGDGEVIAAKTQTLIQASMKLGEAMYNAQREAGEGRRRLKRAPPKRPRTTWSTRSSRKSTATTTRSRRDKAPHGDLPRPMR